MNIKDLVEAGRTREELRQRKEEADKAARFVKLCEAAEDALDEEVFTALGLRKGNWQPDSLRLPQQSGKFELEGEVYKVHLSGDNPMESLQLNLGGVSEALLCRRGAQLIPYQQEVNRKKVEDLLVRATARRKKGVRERIENTLMEVHNYAERATNLNWVRTRTKAIRNLPDGTEGKDDALRRLEAREKVLKEKYAENQEDER